MSETKVTLVSRYPKLDLLDWKKKVLDSLLQNGFSLSIIYSCIDFRAYIKEGVRRYGANFNEEFFKILRQKLFSHRSEPCLYTQQTLSEYAKHKNVPVHFVRSINSDNSLTIMSEIKPDIVVLLGSEILSRQLLAIPVIGTINPHFALLPKYRGMSATEWSIFYGDEVGVSIHFVDPGIDTGDILDRESISVETGDSLHDLREKLRQKSVNLLTRTCIQLRDNTASQIKQTKGDGRQFFKIHPELLDIVKRRLYQYYE